MEHFWFMRVRMKRRKTIRYVRPKEVEKVLQLLE